MATAQDASGNGNTGTYSADVTLGVAGLVSGDPDTAASFSPATNDYCVQNGTVPQQTFSAFTIGGMLKPNNATDANTPQFWNINGNACNIAIATEAAGTLRFVFNPGGGFSGSSTLSSVSTLTNGVLTRFIATWDGTTAKIYFNGVLNASVGFSLADIVAGGGTAWVLDEDLNFYAGTDQFDTTGNFSFDGTLDELFFVANEALTAGEVTTVDNAMTGTGNVRTAINAHTPYIYWRLGDSDTAPLALLDASVQILPMSGAAPTPPQVTPIGQYTRWRVVVRGIDGTYITEYPTAVVQSITWNPPNQPDEAVVLVPIDEPNTNAMRQDLSPHREVEIWRNDKLIFTGPAWLIRGDSTSRALTVTLRDPTSYLQHRYIGRANRTNLLTDGSFEGNGIDWHEFDPKNSMTVSYDTNTKYNGTRSLKLVGTNVNEARFMRQTLTVTAGPLGMPLALSGYCYIDQWLRPGAYGGGMLLERVGVVGPTAYSVAEVVSSTPRRRWVRLETSVRMHPNNTETIRVWVFAIGGTIFWDDIRLTSGESLDFVNEEQGQVVRAIVDYLQGKGRFASLAPEKSDLGITTIMPTTGVKVTHRQYFLSDHQKGYDGTGPGSSGVLDEYLNKSGGVDWRFEPPGRILRGYYPHVGTVRNNVTFTWRYFADEPARNSSWGIIGWNYGSSMEQSSNQIVEVGSVGGQNYTGDPSREEGGFSDPSTLGGLTLELVEQAPVDAGQNQLREIALHRGDQLKNAIATPQIIVQEVRDPITNEVVYPMIGSLLPGDHIFLDVFDGSFTMDGEYRIAQVVLDAQAETLTVTPNPVAV